MGTFAEPVHAGKPAKAHPSHLNEARGMVPHKGEQRATAAGNPQCPNCKPPLLYSPAPATGPEPVMGGGLTGAPGNVTVTPVYWDPSGSFSTSYKNVINGYIHDVASASRTSTNVFSVATQYYQQASSGALQHIQYVITAGKEVDDTNGFRGGCTPAAGFTTCVSDTGLQAELKTLNLTADDSHVYVVMFPSGVETCVTQSGVTYCSGNTGSTGYCAYHSAVQTGATSYLIYANEPYPDLAHCSGNQAPNGNSYADAQVSLIDHEVNESITDWAGAWNDANGYEDGDECAYVYGNPLGGAAGAYYNQVINGNHYYTQDEFSNEDYAKGVGDPPTAGGAAVPGCVQQEELPTASFTGPTTVATSTSASFDGSASSDPDNSTGLTYDWYFGDGSAHSSAAKPSHSWCSAGTYTVVLTVMDYGGWQATATQAVTVTQGAPVVTSVAPTAGPASGGTSVTIAGCAFTGTSGVKFGSTPAANYNFVSDQQLTATTPAHALGTFDVTVTTTVGTSAASPADHFTFGFNGLYVLDAYGGLHGADAPPIANQPYFGWNIARAAKPWPKASNGQVGLVLDGWGGLHPYGSPALSIGQEPYYPNLDVARDFVFLSDGTGGYELDGWGGIHPFSIGSNPLPPQPGQYPYFPGQDVAKRITLLPDASGGYVLDAYGGLHPWSVSGHALPTSIAEYGYWYGNNIARDLWLAPGSSASSASGYVLDAYGGFHPFWSASAAAPVPIAQYGYWRGNDIARAMWFMPASDPTNATGYTLDAYGGIHPFAVSGDPLPPPISQYGYWPGQDLAKSLWGN